MCQEILDINDLKTLVPAYKPHPKFQTFFLEKSAAYTQVNTENNFICFIQHHEIKTISNSYQINVNLFLFLKCMIVLHFVSHQIIGILFHMHLN